MINNNEENIAKKLIGVEKEYIEVSPKEFTKGHGGSLSVKVVLPCYCQAHCPFCFNKETISTQEHKYDKFLDNLPRSLDLIVNNIIDRPITLDITGNEPTFNIDLFSKFMKIIKKYKNKFSKIVLTTNGFHLEECLEDMIGVIDIINISVHHYDYMIRQSIFKTKYIPSDEDLKRIIGKLKINNINCTSVVVLYKKFENFKDFYNKFMEWSINLGFKDTRMRSNFCSSTEFVDEIFNTKMDNETTNKVAALTTKIIKDKKTKFVTYILKGVPDLTKYVLGAELVIDDDGTCYIDYNKRYMVDDLNIKYFNNLYIFK